MEELIKYVKSVKAAHVNDVERLYLNEEVRDILTKNNLTVIELIYRIKHNIPLNKKFLCEQCGKPIRFKHHKYPKFCCHKCANRATTSSNNFKEKAVQSWKLRKEIKYQKEYEQLKDLMQQYNLTLDECKYRLKNNIPLDKVFVCEYCGKPIKFTKKHKYGRFCNNICSTKFTANQPEVQVKRQATIYKKFGVKNVSQNKDIQQKKYDTMKQNGTFNTSEDEELIAELLKQKFPDLKRQFKSKLYPFNCDFYIPSQDLYIEFNGFWTHGWYDNKLIGAFDSNNSQHLEILQEWKIKNTNFYRNAIHTWTVKDPLKVKTAKQNNLNFMVFWTVEEVKDWINSLNN
jgi:hypothetical protein